SEDVPVRLRTLGHHAGDVELDAQRARGLDRGLARRRDRRPDWLATTIAIMIALAAALFLAVITNDDLAAVRAVLDAQEAAWNRGDIEGYMRGYAPGDDTTFVSGDSVTRGWKTVLDRYKKKYDSRAKMGTLDFSDLALRPLGGDDVVVSGAWELKREQDNPHGRFTLIFHRTAAGWRIVYDHSS